MKKQVLMVYYELDKSVADRMQKIRGILEKHCIECRHYNDNITFVKSDVGPADLEDWFRMDLSDKETFLITKLVSTGKILSFNYGLVLVAHSAGVY